MYGPESLWASELHDEAEKKRREMMTRTLRSAYEKETPRDGSSRLDFRPRGGMLVTGLEEKKTLAEAAQIECRVSGRRQGRGGRQAAGRRAG